MSRLKNQLTWSCGHADAIQWFDDALFLSFFHLCDCHHCDIGRSDTRELSQNLCSCCCHVLHVYSLAFLDQSDACTMLRLRCDALIGNVFMPSMIAVTAWQGGGGPWPHTENDSTKPQDFWCRCVPLVALISGRIPGSPNSKHPSVLTRMVSIFVTDGYFDINVIDRQTAAKGLMNQMQLLGVSIRPITVKVE